MSNIYTNKGKRQSAVNRWLLFTLIGVLSFFGLPVSAQDTIEVSDTYPVTVDTVDGGKVTVDKQSAKPGDTVTVTTQTDEGYYLNFLVLTHGTIERYIFDCSWYTDKKSATFVMPDEPVTVTPEFVMADALLASMPTSDTKEVSFPTTDAKINVSGTSEENITSPSYLHLTTGIEGKRIQLSIEDNNFLLSGESLIIYDGADTQAKKLIDIQLPESEPGQIVKFGTIFSSGSDLLIYMAPQADNVFRGRIGLDASLFNSDTQYEISTVPTENGSIEVPSTAKVGEKVTIKVKPAEGFLLTGMTISKEGIEIPHSEYTWYDGTDTLTFDMPASNVDIQYSFSETMTEEALLLYSLPVPTSGTREVKLPEGVSAFVIAADGGLENMYSNNADGKLLLTAPQNQRFNIIMGRPMFADNVDQVTFYDGATTDNRELFIMSNSNDFIRGGIESSGNQMLVSFKTNESGNSYVGFGVVVMMQPADDPGLVGSGTAADPYMLSTDEEWAAFAKLVNNGTKPDACAMLVEDLNIPLADSYTVGTEMHPYTGIFNGNGKTLNIYRGMESADEVAPFLYIDGATIKDLRVVSPDELKASAQSYVGGIACHTVGDKSTISRCAVGVYQTVLDGGTVGGLVADAKAPLDIKDCMVGNRTYLMAYNKAGGMVGNADAQVTISNSLVTVSTINRNPEISASNYVFCGTPENATFYKALYYGTKGAVAQGTEIQRDEYYQLGNVLSTLQDGRTDAAYWMQDAEKSVNEPVFQPYSENLLRGDYDPNLYYDVHTKNYHVGSLLLNTYEGTSSNHPGSLNPAVDIYADYAQLAYRAINGTEDNPALATVCVPFDVSNESLEYMNVKAYTLNSVDNTTVTFKQVNDMEAAKPYIVQTTKGNVLLFAVGTKVYSKAAEPVKVGDVTMTGNYTYMDWYDLSGKNAYILQADDKWHPVPAEENSDVYLSTSRAYLTFANKSAAKAFGMKLSDGETMGISNIRTVDNDGTVRYFDLSGRYIGTSLDGAKAGVYINSNGKKVKK